MPDEHEKSSTPPGVTDRDMDLTAPPPPPEEQWERADADGDPAENMEGQAPTS